MSVTSGIFLSDFCLNVNLLCVLYILHVEVQLHDPHFYVHIAQQQ